jgi:predicted AAA+ superfamily ATPase
MQGAFAVRKSASPSATVGRNEADASMCMTDSLSPAQQQTLNLILDRWPHANLFNVTGGCGSGKSTLLRELRRRFGGSLLTIADLTAATDRHPLALEDMFLERVRAALAHHDFVFLDDLHLITSVVSGGCNGYPRGGWIAAHLQTLVEDLASTPQKLILASDYGLPHPSASWAQSAYLPPFREEDYRFFGGLFLTDDQAARLDYGKIYRFAPHLEAHQWRRSCLTLKRVEQLDTERFLEYLRMEGLGSNVNLEEVQQVTLTDLHGVDDVVRGLETHVVLPLENDDLAQRFGLKPKRGVLLLGPPGTGKTTVGRALAHRLRGKFFLLDGTVISGTDHFYYRVANLFAEAKHNAPSVLFIDDSDVIFQDGSEHGLYRYLLTMLDGLESASSGRVCVMLTAMSLAPMPPALLRSGRIELWLEMKLPDEAARTSILRHHLKDWPTEHGALDVEALAEATPGLTGADLKRVVEDGRNTFAFDLALCRPSRPSIDYFCEAVESLRLNKRRYAEAGYEPTAARAL